MRVKPRPDSKEWIKAAVDKEVDIRSYQARTEDGRTYRRNRRHLKHTREPFLTAQFVEFSANLSRQQQPEGVVPSGNVSVSEAPIRKPASEAPTRKPALEASNRKPTSDVSNSSSVVQPESASVRATSGIVSAPASGVSTLSTRGGRVIRKPVRYES